MPGAVLNTFHAFIIPPAQKTGQAIFRGLRQATKRKLLGLHQHQNSIPLDNTSLKDPQASFPEAGNS